VEQVSRPLLLDLFSGAGGSAVGYHRAGFDVIGVDVEPQPDYPFAFYEGDALTVLRNLMWAYPFCDAAAVHASPPCPRYTTLAKGTNANVDDYPDLIGPTRELLTKTGLPYVIENVPSAPLRYPITLCGEMFGLDVIRHRLFESNVLLLQPKHPRHRGRVAGWRHGVKSTGPYLAVYGRGGDKGTIATRQQAMGCDWITDYDALGQAIPPAYTEYIGAQLLDAVRSAA
jgi:hypothetical protein